MSMRSLPRRLALLLAISFLLTTCGGKYEEQPPGTHPPGPRGPADDVFCKTGNLSKSHPLLCIDAKTMTVNPKSADVFDFEADENNKKTDKSVVIHWFTRRPADVKVKFAEGNACVTKPECDGKGHCFATVIPPTPDQQKAIDDARQKHEKPPVRQCKYQVVKGSDPDDGDLIINPCCW